MTSRPGSQRMDHTPLKVAQPGSLSSSPIPNELCPVAIVRLEQRSAERFRQTRIIEADPEIVFRILAVGSRRPCVADTRTADEDSESGRVVAISIVIRDEAQLRIDR